MLLFLLYITVFFPSFFKNISNLFCLVHHCALPPGTLDPPIYCSVVPNSCTLLQSILALSACPLFYPLSRFSKHISPTQVPAYCLWRVGNCSPEWNVLECDLLLIIEWGAGWWIICWIVQMLLQIFSTWFVTNHVQAHTFIVVQWPTRILISILFFVSTVQTGGGGVGWGWSSTNQQVTLHSWCMILYWWLIHFTCFTQMSHCSPPPGGGARLYLHGVFQTQNRRSELAVQVFAQAAQLRRLSQSVKFAK